jgi:hypothetical protein
MDAGRFDSLARSFSSTSSRRLTLGALLGGSLGFLGLADVPAKRKSGKCKPTCTECNSCKKGKCRRKNGRKRCKKGTCQPKAAGTACTLATGGGGTCCDGVCRDLQSDENACGACGTRCRPNRVCQAGSCFATGACPATTTSICTTLTACSAPAAECACSRSAEGNVVCVTLHDVACPGEPCTTSAECAADWACVDVTSCCTPELPTGSKWCMLECQAPVPA